MLGGVGWSPGQPGPYPDPMVRRFVHAQRSITSLVNQTRCDQGYQADEEQIDSNKPPALM